jgi:hypothetical protein
MRSGRAGRDGVLAGVAATRRRSLSIASRAPRYARGRVELARTCSALSRVSASCGACRARARRGRRSTTSRIRARGTPGRRITPRPRSVSVTLTMRGVAPQPADDPDSRPADLVVSVLAWRSSSACGPDLQRRERRDPQRGLDRLASASTSLQFLGRRAAACFCSSWVTAHSAGSVSAGRPLRFASRSLSVVGLPLALASRLPGHMVRSSPTIGGTPTSSHARGRIADETRRGSLPRHHRLPQPKSLERAAMTQRVSSLITNVAVFLQ